MNAFKVYVCISLTVIIILLAALVGSIIYAGKKANTVSNTVNAKVDSFNQNINDINKSLERINSQLQTENSNLTSRSSIIP
jgi:predicted PurR-regulated permease PerM